MTTISANLQAVLARIHSAALYWGRSPADVRLVAVSKTQPAAFVREAAAAGQLAFGENYVQEGVTKVTDVGLPNLEWHFIGPLQSNKTRPIAEVFHWAHSVDRFKIAERLSAQRPETLPPLQVCLQINISGEKTKSGTSPDDALSLATRIAELPRLKLRGLMTIPEVRGDFAQQRQRDRALVLQRVPV